MLLKKDKKYNPPIVFIENSLTFVSNYAKKQ